MILVTGAAGNLGTAVIENLLKKIEPTNIIALVRDKKKGAGLVERGIQIRVGDYADKASLSAAFEGVNKLLLISSSGQDALNDHKNVIYTAEDAGVKHIFYTSGALSLSSGNSKLGPFYDSYMVTENLIKDSSLAYTIFQNSLYSETLEFFLAADVLESGVYFPAGEGKASFAKREEMGEAIANVLISKGHENQTYLTTGNQTHSFSEIAQMLSSLSGKEVLYYSPGKDEFETQLRAYGVEESDIWLASLLGEIIKNKEYDIASDDLEKLLGRKPTDLKAYLQETFISKK